MKFVFKASENGMEEKHGHNKKKNLQIYETEKLAS